MDRMIPHVGHRCGGLPTYKRLSEDEAVVFLPESVLKCVAFVGCRAQGHFRPLGTGFFVGTKEREGLAAVTYLVTARHVVDDCRKHGEQKAVYVRVNADGKGREVQITAWREHADRTVDVAVCEWISRSEMDLDWIPVGMFDAPEAKEGPIEQVGIGDDLYVVGLFWRHSGTQRNEILCRRGSVAMMPSEPVVIDGQGRTARVHLMEARSVGGLSGSPVFVHVHGLRQPYANNPIYPSPRYTASNWVFFYLWGMVTGHWDIQMKPHQTSKREAKPKERDINTGIATVVPASQILETIMQKNVH